MNELTRGLETTLGPDTGDLKVIQPLLLGFACLRWACIRLTVNVASIWLEQWTCNGRRSPWREISISGTYLHPRVILPHASL
jgi:hypothetical protein